MAAVYSSEHMPNKNLSADGLPSNSGLQFTLNGLPVLFTRVLSLHAKALAWAVFTATAPSTEQQRSNGKNGLEDQEPQIACTNTRQKGTAKH